MLLRVWFVVVSLVVGLIICVLNVRTSVPDRPSTKTFFDFNEIWFVGRGRRVMHDGMQYDPIRGQGQSHEPLKVENSAIINGCVPPFTMGAGK